MSDSCRHSTASGEAEVQTFLFFFVLQINAAHNACNMQTSPSSTIFHTRCCFRYSCKQTVLL